MAQLAWPESSRKRSREEGPASEGFEEHRMKRLQCLPFRTSPPSRRLAPPLAPPLAFSPVSPTLAAAPPPAPHAIAPADNQKPSPTWMHADQDMEMVDSPLPDLEPTADPDAGTCRCPAPELLLGAFQQSPVAPARGLGRMPTPIRATFGAQIRGNNWAGAAGHLMANHAAIRANMESMEAHQVRAVVGGLDCVPRSLGDGPGATETVMQDWGLVQNRRLPSPISESGGEDGVQGSPSMVLGCSASAGQLHVNEHGHSPALLAGLPPRAYSAVELGQTQRSAGLPRPSTPAIDAGMGPGNAMDVEPSATPSPRKGHARSRHTLNSWTAAQPGMKKLFSIGYRADCEKCRLKVPGHFNHIILS